MLPPESTATVVPSAAGLTAPPSSAATPTAPAPSTTSLQRSSSSAIASAVSSSPTVTISSSQLGQDRQRDPARALDRDAVGDRQRRGGLDRLARGHRLRERRAGRGLDADDLRPPACAALIAIATPDASPPPPTGITTCARSGHVLEQLEPERALAGDDRRVVERVHERQPAALGAFERRDQAGVDARAADVDDRALPARGLDLRHRRVGGDEDLARHAAGRRRGGQRLGVVARGGGHDAARAALLAERGQLGGDAADLERARCAAGSRPSARPSRPRARRTCGWRASACGERRSRPPRVRPGRRSR